MKGRLSNLVQPLISKEEIEQLKARGDGTQRFATVLDHLNIPHTPVLELNEPKLDAILEEVFAQC